MRVYIHFLIGLVLSCIFFGDVSANTLDLAGTLTTALIRRSFAAVDADYAVGTQTISSKTLA